MYCPSETPSAILAELKKTAFDVILKNFAEFNLTVVNYNDNIYTVSAGLCDGSMMSLEVYPFYGLHKLTLNLVSASMKVKTSYGGKTYDTLFASAYAARMLDQKNTSYLSLSIPKIALIDISDSWSQLAETTHEYARKLAWFKSLSRQELLGEAIFAFVNKLHCLTNPVTTPMILSDPLSYIEYTPVLSGEDSFVSTRDTALLMHAVREYAYRSFNE